MKYLLAIILSFLLMSMIAGATDVYPSGSSDQNVINEALDKGGTVYLHSGTYEINGPIYITQSFTELTGDKDAIIKVSSSSNQWFTGRTGLINNKGITNNITISNIQINGNLMAFDKSYANYDGGTHNAGRAIYIMGGKSDFLQGVSVHDVQVYDCFSDGIQIAYADNVTVYNNLISNCQHSGEFFICCRYSAFYGNNIAGITSDCMRLDNCENCLVFDNVFLSYTGDHTNGQGTNGENGLQVADEGYSKNGGSDKPTHTTNIEVYNNTFANNGWHSVWLDSTGKGVDNVYIHGNVFVSGEQIETAGVSVTGISFDNPPTKEMSEKVFSSIFDILNVEFTDSGLTNQTADSIHYEAKETEQGKIAGYIKIVGFKNQISIDGKTYISSPDDVLVKYSVIRAPSLTSWFGDIADTKPEVKTSIENGTATARMSVKVKWYNYKRVNGKVSKGKVQTSEYEFKDSCKAPGVLERPKVITGLIYQYPTRFVVSVPSNGLTRIYYEYNGSSATHHYLSGQRKSDGNGTKYTEYSNLEHWNGTLTHEGEFISVTDTLDRSKLKVVASTPYEDIEVNNYTIVEKEFPKEPIARWFYVEIVFLALCTVFGIWLKRQIL